MDEAKFKRLKQGDVVRHVGMDFINYVVTSNYGDRVTVVRTIDMTNPSEWEVVKNV